MRMSIGQYCKFLILAVLWSNGVVAFVLGSEGEDEPYPHFYAPKFDFLGLMIHEVLLVH